MVSKTLDKILDAEKQAEIKTEAARKEAERVVSEANAKAAGMIKSAELEGENEAKRLLEQNKTEIDELFKKNSEACAAAAADIKEKAGAAKERATHIVISKIINA